MDTHPLEQRYFSFTHPKEVQGHYNFPVPSMTNTIVYDATARKYWCVGLGQKINDVPERMVPDWIKAYVLLLS